MTVAYAIVKQECSQATDGWMMDGLLILSDLENRSKSCMIEVVQELHITVFNLMTVAHPILKLEYSQATDRQMDGRVETR